MISHQFLDELWYGRHALSNVLAPVGWLYSGAMLARRLAYTAGILPVRQVDVPVIIVGNITVGGTGKTPLVIWLTGFLRQMGYRPGIISRGYGGSGSRFPQQVRPDSNPSLVGDEPVLIAQRTGAPVAVSPDRYAAARELARHTDCDVLLCDDGLQHHGLHRDIEIIVIDGQRQLGNGRCLPAGPLREPARRLESVDMVVSNGVERRHFYLMEYMSPGLKSLQSDQVVCGFEDLAGKNIHAVAGIGNPEQFFAMLRRRQINVIRHIFQDHHHYRPEDLVFGDDLPVVMTEKDAVKCRDFAGDNCWYVPVEVKMTSAFEHRLTVLMKEITHG